MAAYAAPASPDPNNDPRDGVTQWDSEKGSFFRCKQRTNIQSGIRDVVLAIDINGITVKDQDMEVDLSKHMFTTIKCYQADEKRHAFAFLEVKDGKESVFEFYLSRPKLLHTIVGQYIEQLLAEIQLRKAQKKMEEQKRAQESLAKQRQDQFHNTVVPALSAPPAAKGTARRTSKTASKGEAAAVAQSFKEQPNNMPALQVSNDLLDLQHDDLATTLAASSPMAKSNPRIGALQNDAEVVRRRDSLSQLIREANTGTTPMTAAQVNGTGASSLGFGAPPPTSAQAAASGSALAQQNVQKDLLDLQSMATTPQHQALKMERRDSLSNLLQTRPTPQDLKEKNIVMDDDDFFSALGN